MEKIIKIGVAGFGYWGPNWVRNLYKFDNLEICIIDIDEKRLKTAKKLFPSSKLFNNIDDALNYIDALIIALPTFLHYEIAKKALLNNKHVLVEKPFVINSNQAIELIEIAEKKKLILMVNHIFVYTGSVEKIKELIMNDEIGDLYYFDSIRINLGLFQSDVNVLWDLAVHDISILLYIYEKEPSSLVAVGSSHNPMGIEDIAYLTLYYDNNFIAHITSSWISPVKVRLTLIGGSKKMIVYNDVEPTEKIKIYNTGYSSKLINDEQRYKLLVDYRTGDILIPKIDTTEALEKVAKDFINSILFNSKPRVSAYDGLKVVKILEKANESMKNKGKEIKL